MLIRTKSINVLVRTRLMNVEIVVNTLIITKYESCKCTN